MEKMATQLHSFFASAVNGSFLSLSLSLSLYDGT
jgi:hypothetical protein